MRAAIFNPYLDTLGGGERYTMAFASALVNNGYQVDVEWKNQKIQTKLEKRFGIKLTDVNFVDSVNRGDGYEVVFWVSDGSIPTLRSRHNILHFQFPFKGVKGKSLLNKMKLYRVNNIVCNSRFTKSFIDKEYGVNSTVIYPPIDVKQFVSKRKENVILYVGRFSQLTQHKGQDVLISAFKKLCQSGVSDWKLVLAGGTEVGVDSMSTFYNMVKGYPIEILESPSFKTIKDLYGTSRIFWSASGHGVNEKMNPTKVEHFGMTLVEAMSAGCVPLVVNAGGHKEIIREGKNGYLWKTTNELIKITRSLINETKKTNDIGKIAKKDSEKYSYDVFEKLILKLIE